MATGKMKTIINKIQGFAVIALVLLAFSACDTNVAKPSDLAQTSISVGEFSVGSDTIALGDSTTLSWSVSDPDGQVQYVRIEPSVGEVPLSGTTKVSPTETTIYYVNVYSAGEVIKSRQVAITVLDASGNEIEGTTDGGDTGSTVTTETVCDDGLDDDSDLAIDCDDTDCSTAEVCTVDVGISYAFTSATYTSTNATDAQIPVIGTDTVTLSWESNYENVQINVDGTDVEGLLDATGSLDVTSYVTDTSTLVTIYGRVGGLTLASTQVNVEAQNPSAIDETPTKPVDQVLDFSVSPSSKLFYGQTFDVSWEVSNATSASVTCGSQTQSGTYGEISNLIADGSFTSCSMSVVDINGLSNSHSVSFTVAEFVKDTSLSLPGVTDMVTTSNGGEAYLIAGQTIYHTADYLASKDDISIAGQPTTSVPADTGNINSVDQTADGRLFIATDADVYEYSGGSFKLILTNYGYNQNRALYAETVDGVVRLLVGTNTSLSIANETTDATCSDGSKNKGFCADYYEGFPYLDDKKGDDISFTKFLKNTNSPSEVVAITDAGLARSTDYAETFEIASGSYVDSGIWVGKEGFLWGTSILTVDSEDGVNTYSVPSDLSKQMGSGDGSISAITEYKKIRFIALSSDDSDSAGVYIDSEDYGTFKLNLSENVVALLVQKKYTDSTGKSGPRISAVTSSGEVYRLFYQTSASSGSGLSIGSFSITTPIFSGGWFKGGAL